MNPVTKCACILQSSASKPPWRAGATLLCAAFLCCAGALEVAAVQPEVATLTFNSSSQQTPLGTNGQPAWLQGVEQDGGEFTDNPPCWHASDDQPAGRGRLALDIDHSLLAADLALVVLCDDSTNTDMAVQLFDADNEVIAVDLFYNLVAVGKAAQTDTFIVPLRKYPTATKILIRRVSGDVKVYGVMLQPVVSELEPDIEWQLKLAKLFGDPLSPENPLMKHIQQMAQQSQLSPASAPVQWKPVAVETNGDSVVLVDNDTLGYYNNSLGTILDGSAPQFPTPLMMSGTTPLNDPTFYPSAEPDISKASAVLGNWLAPTPLPLNENWQQPRHIPTSWAINAEVATLYEVDGGTKGTAQLRGNFDVDNGIYIWVNGKYKFGARAGGALSPDGQFEYANIDLGKLPPGKNYIQVLCEDNGIANGFRIKITGVPNQ
jgi:hypothetical protein